MKPPTLFDPDPPNPRKDAAPLAGGAGVNDSDTHGHSNLAALLLTTPAQHNPPPGTSDAAARQIAGPAAKQRADVLAVIVKASTFGATDAEIELVTGLRAQSVSPRLGELRTLGLIADSGRRRITPRGRPAAVWVTPNHTAPTPAPEGGAA